MTKPTLDLSRIGTTGLPVWHGRVYDEILLDLQGEKGRRILREMSEQDPIIGGVLLGVEMLSRQVTWSLKPADDSDKAREVADFVDGALSDISPSWGDTLSEILSMLTYGWSWLEILYKRRQGLKPDEPTKTSRYDDGKIGWGSFAIRGQESLYEWIYENPDGTGELVGLRQMAPPIYRIVDIPRNKSLHFVTRSRRQNPEGISFLRNCYRPWYMKEAIEQIEGIGIERDLAGLPVLWAPENLFSKDASDEEKQLFEQLKKIVTSIKRDEQEGIVMPMSYDEDKNPSYKLELLSTAGQRQFDTNAIINRYDERIAMSMLADFILMGHQAVGSFALSTTKTGLFSTALSAILDVIAAEVNFQAIPRLVLLNSYPLDMCPTLQHGNIESADMAKLGLFLKGLADAGMAVFPNIVLEKYLLEQAGLPFDAADLGSDVNGDPDLVDPETGLPLLPTPALLPTGAPVAKPATVPAKPVPVAKPKPAAAPATAKPVPVAKVASEPRRFVPLGTRMARLAPIFQEQLDPETYTELLKEVMAKGKFSQLSAQSQETILEAEGMVQ